MIENTITKEAHKQGLQIFERLRRTKVDGSIAEDREWPPRTIIKSWHNVGSIAEDNIAKAVTIGAPIPLVGFWGVGDKTTPDHYDEGFLHQLKTLSTSVGQVYKPGMELMLLMADGHALFNGYSHANEYLEQVGYLARQFDIPTQILSELYKEWNITLPSTYDPIDTSSVLYEIWNGKKYTRQKEQLIESATRHHRNNVSPDQAAYWYYVMREQEKKPLSSAFSGALLFANTSPDLGGWLLPKQTMPILYTQAKPPWFQNGNH